MGPTIRAVAPEFKSSTQQDIHTESMGSVELVLPLQQLQHTTRSSQSVPTRGLHSVSTIGVGAGCCRKEGENATAPILQSYQHKRYHILKMKDLKRMLPTKSC